MLIGIPDRFAFLIEKVPEWCDGFVNGLLYVYVNGEMFPKKLYTTTLSDVWSLFDYAFTNPPKDERLYALPDDELFAELRRLRFPEYFTDNEDADEDYRYDDIEYDYRYDIDYYEIGDWGYDIFAVSNGENVRVLIGHWENRESFELVNSTRITLSEFTDLRDKFSEYYHNEIQGEQHG